MELTTRKLLTIVTEAALEDTLVREIENVGTSGYTITDARGKGSRGMRDAAWAPHANIRIEVLCNAATALALCAALRERYSDNYSMVMYVGDVGVLRPEKF
ncbi:MAG: transcriptional regulator [Polaromonas sp.]|nr:transcriptional regulator [Polaromonas sp.]